LTDELVIQHSQLRSRPKVSQTNVANIHNWLHNHQNAILDEEVAFTQQEDDLFAVVAKPKDPLRRLLEQFQRWFLFDFWKDPDRVGSDQTHYYAEARMDRTASFIVTVLGFAMLISPLWILAYVDQTLHRLLVITIFLLVFLGLASVTMVARPLENLAATAA
jgi:hypothetical protein